MTPEHAAAIAALADVVETLTKSTSKVAKEVLKELDDDHRPPMELVRIYLDGSDKTADGMTPAAYLRAAGALGISRRDIADGAEVLVVDGRYAVRTAAGLKIGPATS